MQWQYLWILIFTGEPFQVKETVDYGPNALFNRSHCSLSSPRENMRDRETETEREEHYPEIIY